MASHVRQGQQHHAVACSVALNQSVAYLNRRDQILIKGKKYMVLHCGDPFTPMCILTIQPGQPPLLFPTTSSLMSAGAGGRHGLWRDRILTRKNQDNLQKTSRTCSWSHSRAAKGECFNKFYLLLEDEELMQEVPRWDYRDKPPWWDGSSHFWGGGTIWIFTKGTFHSWSLKNSIVGPALLISAEIQQFSPFWAFIIIGLTFSFICKFNVLKLFLIFFVSSSSVPDFMALTFFSLLCSVSTFFLVFLLFSSLLLIKAMTSHCLEQ